MADKVYMILSNATNTSAVLGTYVLCYNDLYIYDPCYPDLCMYTYICVCYIVLTCAVGLQWSMDLTASVYIARGELQRAEILLQKASQRRVAVGAPLSTVDARYLLSTGVLAALQGRFEEGLNILSEILLKNDQAHLKG